MQTIRQQIVSDDEVRQLITKIATMPERVRQAEDALGKAEFRLSTYNGVDEAKADVDRIEGEAMFEVANEVGLDGKPLYSNDAKRQAAARKMLAGNQEYIDALNRRVAAEKEKAQLGLEVGKAKSILNAVRGESYALRDIAGIIAGLSNEQVAISYMEKIGRIASFVNTELKGVA